MPEEATPPEDPGEALRAAVAAGATVLLLGDADPRPHVEAAASGRAVAHVDATGLVSEDFDRLVRGRLVDGRWELGALSRALQDGGVFLLSHGEALLDDLRARAVRMLLTRQVRLHGPRREDDRSVDAAAGACLVLHVDDHRPLLLQWYPVIRRFATRIRLDVDGPPPVGRR